MTERAATAVAIEQDHHYEAFQTLIKQNVAAHNGPIYTTDAEGLWEAYLNGIAPEQRQHYNCNCCRRFIQTYGGLAKVLNGKILPILWRAGQEIPPAFFTSYVAMHKIVTEAKITGIFYHSHQVWGMPVTGDWTHLHGVTAERSNCPNTVKSASQHMAEKLEDYKMLKRALADYSLEAAVQAVRVLEADVVDRSEKTLGVGQWFLKLHQSLEGLRGNEANTVVWQAVASAPPGWCHIRSTMISTLLDDIYKALPFETIKANWDKKMHPLKYQRPTAPPKAGNIKQAEDLVEKLGLRRAFLRRFARLEDLVYTIWKPTRQEATPAPETGGVFDVLKVPKRGVVREVDLPAKEINVADFVLNVLPTAHKMEAFIGGGGIPMFGMATAVDPEAPPLLQWDGLEGKGRNPLSWYIYTDGSVARQWDLEPNTWVTVNAVTRDIPHMQDQEGFQHYQKSLLFILKGAHDLRHNGGINLFPETIRNELHGVRSVIEAFSKTGDLGDAQLGSAHGLHVVPKGNVQVRVNDKDLYKVVL
jgi:hypothetical protein